MMSGAERLTRARALVAGLLLAGGVGAAWCQGWSVSVSQALQRSDNVLQAEDDAAQTDWMATTGVRGELQAVLGRQSLRLDAGASRRHYRELRDRDATDTDWLAGWNWQTVESWSGSVSASRRRSRYDNTGAVSDDSPQAAQIVQQRLGSVQWGGNALWSLGLSGSEQEVHFSTPALELQANRLRNVSGSLRLSPGPDLRFSLSPSRSKTVYLNTLANGQLQQTRSQQLSLGLQWTPGPRSGVDLSLGRVRTQALQQAPSRSTVGSLGFNWQPTAKLSVSLGHSRNAGSNQTTQQASSALGTDATTVVLLGDSTQRTSQAQLRWATTAKVSLSLAVQTSRAQSTTVVDGVGTLSASDVRHGQQSLRLDYALSRGMQLSCGLTQVQHDLLSVSATGHDYREHRQDCSFSWRLD